MMMAVLLAVFMVACGDDDDDDAAGDGGEAKLPDTTAITATTPAAGGSLAENGTVTITFDEAPKSATVNGQPTTVQGKTATWAANGLSVGQTATLNVAWTSNSGTGGSGTAGPFTITSSDTTPPSITASTVKDGEQGVDPEAINASGIEIKWDEAIQKGTATFVIEGGDDLKWIPTWDQLAGTLKFEVGPAGKNLGNEVTYVIEIIGVKDVVGNAFPDSKITFVTKPKE
jgi:hypothetical protein